MKNVLALLITVMFLGLTLLVATFTFADDRCPLTGNTYTFEVGDATFELSNFNCIYGPGCGGEFDLWYGDFNTGPMYHEVFPFQYYLDGSIMIAGLPCGLTGGGNLKCLIIDTSDYTCHVLGNRTWCVPEDGVILNFELE